MLLSARLIKSLSALLLAVSAHAQIAHVYLSDTLQDKASHIDSLPPSDARLIFAQRLGVSSYHSVNGIDERTVSALNAFAGRSPSFSLFGESSERAQSFYVFDGVEDVDAVISPELRSTRQHFMLDRSVSYASTAQLVWDMANQQAELDILDQSQHGFGHALLTDGSGALGNFHPGSFGDQEGWMEDGLESLIDRSGGKFKLNSALLRATIERMFAHADATGTDVILVLLETNSRSAHKRTDGSWGSYTKAGHPRQSKRQDDVDEDILIDADESHPSSSPDMSVMANVTAPVGILPQCYSSRSSCERTTHNCTGRGSCIARYTLGQGEDVDTCFECRCKAQQKDGLTTYWSGPACQKRDVTSPFWLLTGATIALCSVLAYGLSILISMGNEELPSVLSSGVPTLSSKH